MHLECAPELNANSPQAEQRLWLRLAGPRLTFVKSHEPFSGDDGVAHSHDAGPRDIAVDTEAMPQLGDDGAKHRVVLR